MFGRHRKHGRHDHQGRHGPGGWPEHGRGRLAGRGRERMFEQGELRLVVLNLLSERPRHGYEIIKAIEDLAGGDYTPSPGTIYPTLTLLEELGHATVTVEQAGKKQYGITPAGSAVLDSERTLLARLYARLASTGSVADARRTPQLQRAMQNFKTALHHRLDRGGLEPDAIRKIADAIDRAAVDIERS